MASRSRSSTPDSDVEYVHGERRDGWEELTARSNWLHGQGHTIDTSQGERQWNQVKPPHVNHDGHRPEIRADWQYSEVQPFNMEGDPLFSRLVTRPYSVKGATERPHPTNDTQQPTAS
eukprot:1081134-Rhodomonas_salina.1